MAEQTAPDDPLAAAQTLLVLTEALVRSLEDEAGDPTAILEQRSALLATPFDSHPGDEKMRERLAVVRARVEALEETAFTLLTRRVTETRAALTAVEAGRTAALSYLEEPALPPLLLDRQE